MCALIYIPRKNGMILCSVRDENPHRAKAVAPSIHQGANGSYLCPVDGQSGGTWLGINDHKEAVVLLNGGFVNHLPAVRSYGKSRGLIVNELLSNVGIFDGWNELDLETIEPFTLVVFSNDQLKELVWDGTQKHAHTPNKSVPLIWSSSTLYTPEVKLLRKDLFNKWLTEYPSPGERELSEFLFSFNDPVNGFIMQRSDKLRSLSISTMTQTVNETTLTYHDLITGKNTIQSLSI